MLSRKLIKHKYNPKDRAGWYKLRSSLQGYGNPEVTRVGGSDIGVIMGVDEYRSALELFHQLLRPHPPIHEHNIFTYRGTWQEEHIMKECWSYYDPAFMSNENWLENINSGNRVRKAVRKNFTYINPDYPNIFINLDFQIVRSKVSPEGTLEIKSVSTKSADKYEAGIAPGYVFQDITQMFTSGHKYSELFQMKDSTYPELFTFSVDGQTESIFNNVVTEVDSFVARVNEAKMHLASGMQGDEKEAMLSELEPDVTAGEHVTKFLKDRFKPEFTSEVEIDLDSFDLPDIDLEVPDWAREYLEFGIAKKEAENEQSLRKNKLLNYMLHRSANVININGYGRVSNLGRFNVSKGLIDA